MPQYRTEVVIAPDRYLCIQLPDHLPAGRAQVTIQVLTSDETDLERAGDGATEFGRVERTDARASEFETDHQDIEWWDEFEADHEPVG